jgi:hypothetical protein
MLKTRKHSRTLLVLLLSLAGMPALAENWIQGTVTEITISATGSGSDMIYVKGTFATGCAENGFLLLGTDVFFKETYAALLAAKVSGSPVKFLNVYCHSSGYARGNGYSITN